MTVLQGIADVLSAFNKAKKPIGACCIAPVILANLFPNVRVTLGKEEISEESPFASACGAAKTMGAIHVPCKVGSMDFTIMYSLRRFAWTKRRRLPLVRPICIPAPSM